MNVVLEKKSTMLELNFKQKGTVNVPCDLTKDRKEKIRTLVAGADAVIICSAYSPGKAMYPRPSLGH